MKLIEPEIRHSNLANVLLRMKKSGVPDLYRFDYMDAPPAELLAQSIALLTHLEALDGGWIPITLNFLNLLLIYL
jgi:HrpA-like RNA helicase